jgi:hypothetical protein
MHVTVAAAETVDCASINMGRLDVALASGSNTLRAVEMNEGDTLTFTFQADTRATGTITLVAGDGLQRRLIYGPRATQVTYAAVRPGVVGFRLATKGGKVTTFVTTCNPARASGAKADMGVPLSFGVTASKDVTATPVTTPSTSNLQWLGGEQSAKEAQAGMYRVNLKLQPALMIGALAQFDQASDPLLGPAGLSDQRWQAGPVTSVQLGGGLSLDARAAWGPADPLITHAANRQTLDARLTSKQEAGPWRFSSSIGVAHVQERFGTAAEHSAEMAYHMDVGHSIYIEPKIMVGTFWNLGDAPTAGMATGAQHEPRHMAETGITFGAADGTKLQIGGGVQEGETRSDNVWSGKIQLNFPLK